MYTFINLEIFLCNNIQLTIIKKAQHNIRIFLDNPSSQVNENIIYMCVDNDYVDISEDKQLPSIIS